VPVDAEPLVEKTLFTTIRTGLRWKSRRWYDGKR